jgi:tetratricopeptide (TPR) repeat protein
MEQVLAGPGTVLAGRYTIERELGRGGMATVYLAHDLRHRRSVAVKILRPEVAVILGSDRFLREIEIAARLTHPHILPLHDSGEAGDLLYYVMPFIGGESLRDRIRREGRLPVEAAVRITREVADALSYAHGQGVVHRDIKPGNILLEAGHAVVSDFGVARAVSEAAGDEITTSGLVVGTPMYMSPEQVAGSRVDGRSDVYSLGCVLYEMLAGHPPFTGPTAQAIAAEHIQRPVPSLEAERADIPKPVVAALERALDKEPAERFQTAENFQDALTSTDSRALVKRRKGWGPRRRFIAVGVAAGFLLVTLFVAIQKRINAAGHNGVGIVLVPFETVSSASRQGPLPHLLFADALEWVPGLHPLDGTRLLSTGGRARGMALSDLLRDAQHLGGKYLVTGAVIPAAEGSRVTVDLYSVRDGERVVRGADTSIGGRLDGAVGRLALQSIRAMAEREQLDLGARKAMFSSTSSATALGELIQGQAEFSRGDYDAAATAFARAIEADSTCGLAYLRLSAAQSFRFEYASALATLEAGLRQRDRLPARWVNLLEARRHYALGEGESAIEGFQTAVLDDREDIDAWFGLGESLFHLATYTGHSPLESQGALERTIELDSTFFPIYDHLVDLALYERDAARAARYLRHMPPGEQATLARQNAMVLRFQSGPKRLEALRQLRLVDRQALSQLVVLWSLGAADLPLVDTIASLLTESGRTPDDRLRGAEYRLVALAGLGRWPEALAAWQREGADQPFDGWVVHAYLAGYPAERVAGPMLEWARSQVSRGVIPDFTLPPWDERQQGFQALVHRATLEGDSAEVLGLLRRMRTARRATDLTDPTAGSLEASLQARLALLAGDSTQAILSLRRSLARIYHPVSWYYPLTSMAPQRRLLAELLRAHGAPVEAKRWRNSFRNSWSIGDVLFAAAPQH